MQKRRFVRGGELVVAGLDLFKKFRNQRSRLRTGVLRSHVFQRRYPFLFHPALVVAGEGRRVGQVTEQTVGDKLKVPLFAFPEIHAVGRHGFQVVFPLHGPSAHFLQAGYPAGP